MCAVEASLPGGGAANRGGQFNLDKDQTASTQVVQGQFNYFKVHTRDRCGKKNTCVTTRNRQRPWTPDRTSGSAWSTRRVYSHNLPVGGRTGHRPDDGGSSRVILIRHQVSGSFDFFFNHMKYFHPSFCLPPHVEICWQKLDKKKYTENVYKYLIYLHNFKIHKNSGITNEEQNLKVGEKRFPMIPQ